MKITIYLGERYTYSNGVKMLRFAPEVVVGLTIDARMCESAKTQVGCDRFWDTHSAMERCLSEGAIRLAKIIKDSNPQKGYEYEIINAKRIRHTNYQIVDCPPLRPRFVDHFRVELGKALGCI